MKENLLYKYRSIQNKIIKILTLLRGGMSYSQDLSREIYFPAP